MISSKHVQGIGALLRQNKFFISFELLIVALIIILTPSPLISTPSLVILGWLSLRARGAAWKDVGLSSPHNLILTLLGGIAIGLLLLFSDLYFTEPLLSRWLGGKPDLGQFATLKGNIVLLLLSVTLIAWLLAAFGEEMAYRGYILNRLAELLGGGGIAWVVAVLVMSVLFGVIHLWQGLIGVVTAIKAGLIFGGLYLIARKNLWLPLITHGVYDTAAFILIFLGKYHGM